MTISKSSGSSPFLTTSQHTLPPSDMRINELPSLARRNKHHYLEFGGGSLSVRASMRYQKLAKSDSPCAALFSVTFGVLCGQVL
jgi:hypothetical protein